MELGHWRTESVIQCQVDNSYYFSDPLYKERRGMGLGVRGGGIREVEGSTRGEERDV